MNPLTPDSEVARLREELIQAKQKAKEWKEKYRKLDMSVRCEYCDPNGTIWECCTKRQYEQASEIERLKAELAAFAPAPEEAISIPADLNQQNKENTHSLNEWMKLQEEINSDIASELQSLRDEIQKIKEIK